MAQRRKLDIADFRECIERGEVKGVYHIKGKTNPLDCITKSYCAAGNGTKQTREIFCQILKSGRYKPDFSEDKRQQKGDPQPNNPKKVSQADALLIHACQRRFLDPVTVNSEAFSSWAQWDRQLLFPAGPDDLWSEASDED